jgi:aryl-alcohol dehydrogenase (NADP+)
MKALSVSERNGWARFVSMQNHYNRVYREEEREMLPLCDDQGVGVIPWSPLARGALTRAPASTTARQEADEFGKTLYGTADAQIAVEVAAIAAERGVSRAQVALAWVSRHPAVTAPIVGVTKPHHLDDALASLDLTLTDDEVRRLEAPYTPQPVQGFA